MNMWRWLWVCGIGVAIAGLVYAQNQGQRPSQAPPPAQRDQPPLKTLEQKVSYSIGLRIGQSIKRQNLDVNPKLVAQGLRDALAGREPRLTPQQMRQAMLAYQQKLQDQQARQAKKNLKQAQAFLKKNAKKPGVKTLPSGLQYKVLEQGQGPTPQPTDKVRVHYRGRLLNGTVFDSSYKRGEPAVFGVNRVIEGWTQALTRMNVGAEWRLFIPPELAYGEQGRPGIPPNALLIFDVKLLGIE